MWSYKIKENYFSHPCAVVNNIIFHLGMSLMLMCSCATSFAAEPLFNLWEYEVRGVTALPPEKIEGALAPFLGAEKGFSTVESAAQALEKLYRESGFPVVTVDIPEQDVVDGRVILIVIEGRVGKIKVVDSDYFLLSDIKQRIPSISPGGLLNAQALQKDLDKLNSLSGDLRVVPLLKQGENPGEVDIELKVKDTMPMHGEIEFNNYASAQTSDTRLTASLGYDNLWHKYHSFSLQMMVTPSKMGEIEVLSGTYVLPVESGASRLAIYGVTSSSEIDVFSATESGLLVRGDSKIAGLRYIKPINESSTFQHVITLGADYKDVLEEVLFTDEEEKEGILTPLDYGVAAAEYKATWRKEKQIVQAGGGVFLGIRGSLNETAEFADKRYRAEANFVYWKASLQHSIKLPADITLSSKLRAQFTDAPLISNEQISAGGNNSVRGYYESQAMGDRGLGISVEAFSPELFSRVKYMSDLTLSTFVEGMEVVTLIPLPGEGDDRDIASIIGAKESTSLYSSGIGLSLSLFKDINLKMDIAYPLKDVCDTNCGENIGDVEKGDRLTTINISYKY